MFFHFWRVCLPASSKVFWTLKPGKGMVAAWAHQTSSSIKGTPCKVQVDLRSIAFYSFLKGSHAAACLKHFNVRTPDEQVSELIWLVNQPPLTYPPETRSSYPLVSLNTALLNPHLWGVGTFGGDGYRLTSHEIGLATFCPPVKGIYKTRHEQIGKNAVPRILTIFYRNCFPTHMEHGKKVSLCSMHGIFTYIWIDFTVFM